MKLDCGNKNLMRLIVKERNVDGWTHSSAVVAKMLKEHMPPELIEQKLDEGGNWVRLTKQGQSVFDAMEYL